MPKKKRPETPEQQSERFKRSAQELIDAGILNPTEGDAGLDEFVRNKSAKPDEADDA
jgi:hypothetical protein